MRSTFTAARNTPLPRDAEQGGLRRPGQSHARLRWHASRAPLDCRRTTTRPVSSYALFQWWLLLSQHPGCRCRRTSFPTEHALWDLSRRSGLFPSRRRSLAPAVSLPRHRRPAFVVWLGVVSSRPRTHPAPYLRPPLVLSDAQDSRGCTAMHFGENQLSPGSIGISPLPTGHPHALQRTWVRAFTECYPRCTLPMGSSPGFGSTPTD